MRDHRFAANSVQLCVAAACPSPSHDVEALFSGRQCFFGLSGQLEPVQSSKDVQQPSTSLTIGNQVVTLNGNHMVTASTTTHEAVFRAIADPTRREILRLLRGRQRSVGELASNFTQSRPAISKHLRLLRSAGLVLTHERGTARIYELNAKPLRAVDHWLRDYEAFWTTSLRKLKRYVEEHP